MTDIVHTCNIHGPLIKEQTYGWDEILIGTRCTPRCILCRKQYDKNRSVNLKNNNETSVQCIKCKEIKLKKHFSKYEFNKRNSICKECRTIYQIDFKIRIIENKYGITKDEYLGMVKNQENKCAICQKEETSKSTKQRSNVIKSLCVDHCHETGKIRELLCHKCNSALGLFNDDFELLIKASEYLKKHKKPAEAG